MPAPVTSLAQLYLGKTYTYDDYLTWQHEERELLRLWGAVVPVADAAGPLP